MGLGLSFEERVYGEVGEGASGERLEEEVEGGETCRRPERSQCGGSGEQLVVIGEQIWLVIGERVTVMTYCNLSPSVG